MHEQTLQDIGPHTLDRMVRSSSYTISLHDTNALIDRGLDPKETIARTFFILLRARNYTRDLSSRIAQNDTGADQNNALGPLCIHPLVPYSLEP